MSLMKNQGLVVTLCVCVCLSGCISYLDFVAIDSGYAPGDLKWKKKGETVDDVKNSRIKCANDTADHSGLSGKVRNDDAYDICMIRGGYDVIARPKGYLNSCEKGSPFSQRIACQHYQNQINTQINGVRLD